MNPLLSRASRLIPGSIYGHTSPILSHPQTAPAFAIKAKGARYIDADGNEWLDLMCAYGTNILGYAHPTVLEAAIRQLHNSDCLNHPTPLMLDLADRLISLTQFAAWAVFAKNGTDVTTYAIQVAREHTRRPKILSISGAYHGTAPWCAPSIAGILPEERRHIHTFPWNDLNHFHTLIKKHHNQIAAIILTPFHHPNFAPAQLPSPDFFPTIQNTCRQHGIQIILDDIRAGFRLHHRGSHKIFNLTPDLACYGKALANGFPISACLGAAHLRRAAERVFFTGSTWHSAASMAAALATLDLIEKNNIPQFLHQQGLRLKNSLEQLAAQHSLSFTLTGPPAMPTPHFENDPSLLLLQTFTHLLMRQHVFLHPHHNGFLCAAHTDYEINEIIHRSQIAFASLKSTLSQTHPHTYPHPTTHD
ncbi:MAG: aminotransferase class III-fold pyridoxal phosphate-dependent enzyme [Methylacidiphilales bacterium]|nr:aminotransferase class III-fold pyridoxal phosphate-dependent enzyme [Candidatus Methylacidiphilales bacterium]MDW8349651.1 aminotransferase class III-fold pyridoxal phosphate-dependent enzyme [Verrucomicrobiae bacterium]